MKDASVQQQSSYLNRYHLKVTLRLVLLSESTSVLQTLSSIAFGTHVNLFPIDSECCFYLHFQMHDAVCQNIATPKVILHAAVTSYDSALL
jgi:hypothetical protein